MAIVDIGTAVNYVRVINTPGVVGVAEILRSDDATVSKLPAALCKTGSDLPAALININKD